MLGEIPRHAKQTRCDNKDWVIVYLCQTGIKRTMTDFYGNEFRFFSRVNRKKCIQIK